jgi:hypothetical protein
MYVVVLRPQRQGSSQSPREPASDAQSEPLPRGNIQQFLRGKPKRTRIPDNIMWSNNVQKQGPICGPYGTICAHYGPKLRDRGRPQATLTSPATSVVYTPNPHDFHFRSHWPNMPCDSLSRFYRKCVNECCVICCGIFEQLLVAFGLLSGCFLVVCSLLWLLRSYECSLLWHMMWDMFWNMVWNSLWDI